MLMSAQKEKNEIALEKVYIILIQLFKIDLELIFTFLMFN